MNNKRHDYLKRLPLEYYRGQAYVHWSLTMEDRRTGWLIPILLLQISRDPHSCGISIRGMLSLVLLYAGPHPYALDWHFRR
ncbi:hypothetical protein Pr1d_07700 [Bythopirellula goksoeyrii]|uniref:Uncharacterized protein n=1 Tax=Bythopirellula goksoeyrii TaxID=1400387 RepID=A0A5B9Q986_9BACT|nr:hypothetical protein Pr1d_07700 [Bythopirellula goksoeyrii]